MDITLNQIKEYCEENNIKLDIPSSEEDQLPVTMQIQPYGDPEAETYFNYYIENSVEIDKWLAKKINKNNNQ